MTKRMIQLTLAIGTGIIALLAMVTLLVGPVRPALAAGPDCTVDPGGGGDYTTIQAAVDDPGCTTINVGAGTYNENVAIARSLTLQGAGAASTVVNGGGAGVVISITNNADVTIDGFTITGGDGTSNVHPGSGGGFYSGGGGIFIQEATAIIRDNAIVDNVGSQITTTAGLGGGILVITSTNPVQIYDNTIQTNVAQSVTLAASIPIPPGAGGGIFIGDASSAIISGNQVLSNVAVRSNIPPQSAFAGGGGIAFGGSGEQITLDQNTIQGNVANESGVGDGSGGGIALWGKVATVTHNSIGKNIAAISGTYGGGGGVYAGGDIEMLTLTDNEVRGNVAIQSVTVSGSGNWGGGDGGGVHIYSQAYTPTVVIEDNDITDNTAAITVTVSGGANGGGNGGGVNMGRVAAATIRNNEVRGNAGMVLGTVTGGGSGAWGNGGGFNLREVLTVTLKMNQIEYNAGAERTTLASGADGGGGGGGIGIAQSEALVSGNVISGNTANLDGDGWGGGVFVNENSTVIMGGNFILGNRMNPTYSGGSGGVWVWQSTLTSINNMVARNYDGIGGGDGGGTVSNLTLMNDTLYDNGNVGVSVNDSSTAYVTNTIVYSHQTGLEENAPAATITGDYNLVSNTINYAGGATGGSNDIIGQDPLFKNAAADDLRLTSGSPAIDQGDATLAPGVDFEGDPRPLGAGVDIGADEFGKVVYLSIILKNASP